MTGSFCIEYKLDDCDLDFFENYPMIDRNYREVEYHVVSQKHIFKDFNRSIFTLKITLKIILITILPSPTIKITVFEVTPIIRFVVFDC